MSHTHLNFSGLVLRTFAAVVGASPFALAQTYVPIPAPCPIARGAFGSAVDLLDFNGDGSLDIAIGSSGHDAVFIYYGPSFLVWQAIDSTGILPPGVCPAAPTGTLMGASLASRAVDLVAGDELAIGAPGASVGASAGAGVAYLAGGGVGLLTVASASPQTGASMGTSVALGDFDADGRIDLAAGAPETNVSGTCSPVATEGRVHVFRNSFAVETLIDNPRAGQAGACNGWFGVDMATGDTDSDGLDDLFVSSEANPVGAIANAGAIYRYGGAVIGAGGVVTTPLEIVDPVPLSCDPGARFSKSIDVRGSLLIAGAPRKDLPNTCSRVDIGATFAFPGPGFSGSLLPPAGLTALLGFRVVLADRVGSAAADVIGFSLSTNSLLIWDGTALGSAPIVVAGPTGGGAHWVYGVAAGQLIPGGVEEVVLGDPDFSGATGRVMILQ